MVQEEKLLIKIFNNAPVGIITFLKDGTVDYFNESLVKFCKLYKLNIPELKGGNLFNEEIFAGADLAEDLKLLKDGIPFEKEIKSLKTIKQGNISLIVKATPFFEDKKFSGGILILEDIEILAVAKRNREERDELVEKILSGISNYIFVTDLEGKIKFSFGNDLTKLGKSASLPQDYTIYNFLPVQSQNKLQNSIEVVKSDLTTTTVNLETEIDGKPIFFNCKIEPDLDKRRKLRFLIIQFNDITESVIGKKSLVKERDELLKLQSISESLSDALIVIDNSGKILFWNKPAESLFGYKKSEVYGKFIGRILGLFDSELFENIKSQLDVSGIWKKEITVFGKDKEKEIVETKFTFSGPEKNEIIVLCSDITERVLTEQELRATEEKFRFLTTQSEELNCTVEPDGKIIYINPAFVKKLKYSENELLKKNLKDLVERNKADALNNDLRSFEKLIGHKFEFYFTSKYNNSLLLSSRFAPVLNEAGKIKYFNCFFTDITVSKEEEANLLLFKALFESSNDGIAVECNKEFVTVNDTFAHIFGYSSSDDLLNKRVINLVADSDSTKVTEFIQQVETGKRKSGRFEFLGKKLDNSQFYAEVTVASFTFQKKIHLIMIARNVTERKRNQQAIRESEEKYRNITENIDDFLFTFERVDNKLRPVFYTSSVEKTTGYTQTDLLSDYKLFMKIIHPDDLNAVKEKLKNILKSKIQLSVEFEFRLISKQGNVVWVRTKINVIRNKDGKIHKLYGLVSDISLRKRAEEELNKSTQNLVKLNETKDRFISIISHDLRTPFSSILGFTDLLLNDEGLSEGEKKQYVEFIRESSNSMLSLVNSLLDWTRLQTGRIRFEPERIEAQKIISKAINALSGAAFQKGITLSSNIPDDLLVFVDDSLVLQVFNNLISNAIKFTNRDGNITVSVTGNGTSRFLEFSVKDDGTGIKKEDLGKLFNVDTKHTSEGTAGEKGSGLGLSLVNEIIEKHGGSIKVESEYGKGSNFIFTLPIASANILLVDDSKTDKLLYSKIIRHVAPDYNVDVASNGKEAMEYILKSPPALVITDHLMPEMNGFELVMELKKAEIKGKPPVIVLASELDRSIIFDYNELGVEYVFHKPVTLSDFKKAVEKSLKKGMSME